MSLGCCKPCGNQKDKFNHQLLVTIVNDQKFQSPIFGHHNRQLIFFNLPENSGRLKTFVNYLKQI
jgi:hypothetical protein